MHGVLIDFLQAVRSIRKAPGFAVVAIVLIALGTGATTGIFELFNAIRLGMLPVRQPEQLVELRINDMTHARGNWLRDAAVTNPLWEEIRNHEQVFDGMFAWASEALQVSTRGESQQLNGLWVSGNFFRVLDVNPVLGRVFSAQDDKRGCGLASGAVISFPFWQREFGGDPSVLGRALRIGNQSVQIIGVTPVDFFGLEVGRTFDVALPICSEPTLLAGDDRLKSGITWWLTVMARRKANFGMRQVSAMLQAESPQIFRATLPAAYPPESVKPYLAMKILTTPAGYGISRMREQYARPLLFLLGLTGLVLLIACINLANLMLIRGNNRVREVSLRLAVGSSQPRLIRHVLTEGLVLATLGNVCGLFLGQTLVRILIALVQTGREPIFLKVHLGFRVFAFAATMALFTCLLFSIGPVLHAIRTDPGDALRSGSRATSSRRSALVRHALLCSQIAFALVLLIVGLLFTKTLRNLESLNPGFDAKGILIADVSFAEVKLSPTQNASFRRQLLDKIRRLPGVASAAEMTVIPATGADWNNRVWPSGSDLQHAHDAMRAMIGPGYFGTLGTPLLAGRDYTDGDLATYSKVAIVNEKFLRELFGDSNAVGEHFWIERTPYEPQTAYEIIGVAKNSKYHDLRETSSPVMFMPLFKPAQERPWARVAIRSRIATATVAAELRDAFARTEPAMGYSVRDFATMIGESLLRERLMATLSGFFGVLAAVLTAIGIYGVIGYTISLRQNEIGIRMALGADRLKVLTLIGRDMVSILMIGLSAGIVLALAAEHAASAQLFQLRTADWQTYAVASLFLIVLVAVSSYLPASRGASLNPLEVLRKE